MGYYVDMDLREVVIPADKVEGCLAAINEMHKDHNLEAYASGGSFGGDSASKPVRERKWYSWVTNPPPEGFPDLKDALEAWRYEVSVLGDGSVKIEYFAGEKYGNDERLFRSIAPFVVEGATIDCRGEDGALWRFVFENGAAIEEAGYVVYSRRGF